jgi:hypothetical protein
MYLADGDFESQDTAPKPNRKHRAGKGAHKEPGCATFDRLPLIVPFDVPSEDVYAPALHAPEILEEWPRKSTDPPIGNFKKTEHDYSNKDGMVHFIPVPAEDDGQPVVVQVNRLTEEEKLQHIVNAYEVKGVYYNIRKGESPKFNNAIGDRGWALPGTSYCSKHVNFFLAYWFNYNEHFTIAGAYANGTALALADSNAHARKDKTSFRGYEEFLTGVTGVTGEKPPYKPVWDRVWKYFESDGKLNAAGRSLIASMSDFNLYCVSDFQSARNKYRAATKVVKWLRENKASLEDTTSLDKVLLDAGIHDKKTRDKMLGAKPYPLNGHLVDAVVGGIGSVAAQLERLDIDGFGEMLDNDVAPLLTQDHHCGILLRRAAGGADPKGKPDNKDYELWKFTADGVSRDAWKNTSDGADWKKSEPRVGKKPVRRKKETDEQFEARQQKYEQDRDAHNEWNAGCDDAYDDAMNVPRYKIVMRPFEDVTRRKGFHIAIWALNPLRPGGFSPAVDPKSKDIDIDVPPRFVKGA